jgi:D-xylose transport system substrate-binding protein
MVTNNPTLGNILTDANGKTLYIFLNDKAGVSNCTGACLAKWPAFSAAQGATPTAGSGVTGTLGTITRSDGTVQVTINQMPLYYFGGDTKPGDTNGQGIGNVWYVVGPDGNPIKTAPGAAAAGTPGAAATSAPGSAAATSAPSAGGAAAAVPTPTPNASATGKIALLLPENKTARYEAADRPYFESELKIICPNCQVIYSNANQDSNLQLSQAEAALTNGAKVLVLDPVDSAAAAVIADKAQAQGVPVIAYDRLILNSAGVNDYISFDNMKVGQLQAQALIDRLNQLGIQKPTIVMINGSPTDNNAKQFKAGAHSVFDPLVAAGKLVIAKEYDTPDWSPNQAQNEMQQALTALNNKVDGVYCANDGTAGGAIAAMKAAGISPLPPVTGQDAQLTGIQNILTGDQYMTIYKAIRPEADDAAILATYLLTGSQVPAGMTNGVTVNNGKADVPSILLNPVVVTRDNIASTVVKDGFLTAQQICTANYASICATLGIK